MAQTLVKLYAHIVFSTKHREAWIGEEIEGKLHGYMTGIVKKLDAKLVRIGGMADHVHLLVLQSKTMALAEFMRVLKKESSAWVKGERAEMAGFHWQDGYAAFSVGESGVQKCVEYIDDQKRHHARMTFKEELVMLLEKHGVEYDERYLWE